MEIVVSNKASQPLYEQIASQIKAAIISGELQAGEAIPSVRSLAKSLQISILTVQKAYATLEAIKIARTSGISLNKLTELLTLMYQEDE